MNPDPVRAIADAVLYEGYILWPYRRSALKNQRRFTFGGVYPPGHAHDHPDDPAAMHTEVLLTASAQARLHVTVRFLQVVRRAAAREGVGGLEEVDELEVGGERYTSWEEAVERQIAAPALALSELARTPHRAAIAVAAGREAENLAQGAALIRSWHALEGELQVGAERLDTADTWRVSIHIENTTPFPGGGREDALARTFCSTHTMLHASAAQIRLPGRPARKSQAGSRGLPQRRHLAGPGGRARRPTTVLSSPIILEDYPRVAPESPGDLFDGGEIDQLLVLNILALTDEEKAEMAASDPRAKEILDRTQALTPDQLMALARDDPRVRDGQVSYWEELERPGPDSVMVAGSELRPGARVRLSPHKGGDVFDSVLAGRSAVIEGIEQDLDGNITLAVVVEDDPGRDLGFARQPGHRFFFSPTEVEPLPAQPASAAA